MSGFLIAVAIVVWFAVIAWAAFTASERHMNGKPWIAHAVTAAAVFTLGLGLAINAAAAEDGGPCLRYETGVMPTGKTVVPYQYCVERGEWVR